MWNVVITLSSVGYGELYPVTFFGRIVGTAICFWGVFIVSMFVVTVSAFLDHTGGESKSFELIIALHWKLMLKKAGVRLIQLAYKYKLLNKNVKATEYELANSYREFLYHKIQFKHIAKVVKGLGNTCVS